MKVSKVLQKKERLEHFVDLAARDSDDSNDGADTDLTSEDWNPMYVQIGERLHYDFERQPNCCCHLCEGGKCDGDECFCGREPFIGCHPDVKSQLPRVLRHMGVTAKEWRAWFEELEDIQRRKAPTAWCEWCCNLCPTLWVEMQPITCEASLLVFFFSWLCQCCCPLAWLPCAFGGWHKALRRWQSKVNDRLHPMGCFAKIRCFNKTHSGAELKSEHHIDSRFLVDRCQRHQLPQDNPIAYYPLTLLIISLDNSLQPKLEDERVYEKKKCNYAVDWSRAC